MQVPTSSGDIMYFPSVDRPTNSCIYYNNTKADKGSKAKPMELGQMCQWSMANGVIWTIATASLVMDYMLGEPNRPLDKRFGIWWLIIYFGSFFLGTSGETAH